MSVIFKDSLISEIQVYEYFPLVRYMYLLLKSVNSGIRDEQSLGPIKRKQDTVIKLSKNAFFSLNKGQLFLDFPELTRDSTDLSVVALIDIK